MERSAVTIQDIAERAGVTKTTVSAVLRGGASNVFVSEATRLRVLDLARDMGYRPNAAARALSTGRTGVIEFWTQNVTNPFFNTVFHSTRKRLATSQQAVMLLELATGDGLVPSAIAPAWPADGLLIFDLPVKRDLLATLLRARGVADRPYVSLGTYYDPEADFVAVDLYAGAAEAVQHLLAPGRSRVAYLVDHASYYPKEPRWRAYTERVQAVGQEPEWLVAPDSSRAASRDFVREYVREHGCPEALFCHNDGMAVGAYRACRDLGIKIPTDVAIVGCDGIEEIEYLDCPLSTVAQPVETMCDLAVQFLQARLVRPDLPVQQRMLTPELVVRQSSAP